MRYFFLAALVPAALSAQPSQEAARPISLAEAVQLAQQNSPQMVSARNSINANEATVRTRWSAFLPTFSGSVSSSWGGGQTINSAGQIVDRNNVTPWSWNRRLSANWLLFDGGDRNFQLRAARANVDAAEANAVATEFSVAYSVSQQFYAALAATESRSAALTALAEAQQNQRAANARIASGAATRSDSLRAVISVGNQQLAVMRSEERRV